jgi:iron complex transport system substrate-binding protein
MIPLRLAMGNHHSCQSPASRHSITLCKISGNGKMKQCRKNILAVLIALLVGVSGFGRMAFADGVSIASGINGTDYAVDFPEAPRRAVSLSHFTTETMLALGLEQRMAGVAWMDNEPLPEFRAAFDTIPILSERYPSREILLNAEPDFVTGWASLFSDKNFPPSFLERNGIVFYLPRVEYLGATMDSVYEDFMLLGRIFRVEAKAATVVKDMRTKIGTISQKTAAIRPVTVFMYNSGDTAPYAAGNGLPSDLIRLAGGKNIYGEAPGKWLTVQWESVMEQNPDWIIVMQFYSSSMDAVKKVNLLKTNAATKTLDAVKNDRILVMELSDVTSGPRAPAAVERMAKHFHPELFE